MNRSTEREERAAGDHAPDGSDQRILRVSPDGPAESSVGVLRKRIDELAEAIRDKDLDRLMGCYAPEVVAFDLRPPLEVQGGEGYRNRFAAWFAAFEGPLGFEYHDLRVVPGESTAFCHYLALVTGARPGGERKSGYWIRGTTCFERCEGQWLVTHEHISVPSGT